MPGRLTPQIPDSGFHKHKSVSEQKAHTPDQTYFELPAGFLNLQRNIGNSGVKRMLASNAPIQRSKAEELPVEQGGLMDPFSSKSDQSIAQGGLVDPFSGQSNQNSSGGKSGQSIEQGGLVNPFGNKSGQSIEQGGLVDPFRDKWK